jgi:cytochrome c biogenesis protein CcmG, thiol:disulfide interchange protein DsbE
VLLLAALIGLFAKSLLDNHTSVAAEIADGGHPTAPNFTLPDISGHGTTSLSAFRGKVVVLNFWASWCDPCKTEAPALQEIASKYGSRGVAVVGVDSQDATSDARAFAERYHLRYPLVHAQGTGIYHRWGLSAYPETFIIDAKGRVVHHFAGPVTGQIVEQQIAPLLANA